MFHLRLAPSQAVRIPYYKLGVYGYWRLFWLESIDMIRFLSWLNMVFIMDSIRRIILCRKSSRGDWPLN